MPTGCDAACQILNSLCIVKAYPAQTGFEPTPSRCGTDAGLDLRDGIHSLGDVLHSGKIRPSAFADIEVCDADLHEKRNIRSGESICFRCVDVYTVYIEHTISRIVIRALLGILQNLERSFLRLGVRPAITDAVPGNGSLAFLHIELREIPPLNNGAEVLNISKARGIAAILDDLYGFLVIGAALQTIIAEFAAVLRSK